MDQKTRNIINKTLKIPFNLLELNYEELEEFKKIMEHTSKRRNFLDRPLSYYQNMFVELKNMMKILIAELDMKKYLKHLNEELEKEKENKKNILRHLEKINGSKKYQKQLKVSEEKILDVKKKIKEAEKLKVKYGNNIKMAGAVFILYGGEITYLFSGAYHEFMCFNAQYRIQWEMIKYGLKNGFIRYNFGGISGNFNKDHPLYGLYTFKRGFGGVVEELIGEFDLVISPFYYFLYNRSLKIYNFIKKLKK